MFSNQPRKFYRRSPLIEVICQLRFPDILKIEAHEPADFQDAIRQVYPQYAKRIEQLPPQNAGGKMVEQGTVNNYQFISADGGWKVSLTKGFIALSTTRYTRWEEFAKRLDVVLAAFIKIYQPAYFTRVGLRYMNAVNKAALGFAETPWHELIAPGYLGLMATAPVRSTNRRSSCWTSMCSLTAKCPSGRLRAHSTSSTTTQEASFPVPSGSRCWTPWSRKRTDCFGIFTIRKNPPAPTSRRIFSFQDLDAAAGFQRLVLEQQQLFGKQPGEPA